MYEGINMENKTDSKFLNELMSLKEQLLFEGTLEIPDGVSNVIIAGMGGSGIVGKIFQEIYNQVPVFVSSGYSLPEFVGKESMAICISYSGNTEETIAAHDDAKRKGAHTAVITSGGTLSEMDDNKVIIPKGISPRSAFGYMLMPLLNSFGSIRGEEIQEARMLLGKLDGDSLAEKEIADEIFAGELLPIVYSTAPSESIAYRWSTQFNENSKILALWGSFPELNHNNTMALKSTYRKNVFYPICIRSSNDSRITARIKATEEVTGMKFRRIVEPEGSSVFARTMYLIHVGDYISYHLAKLRNVDPLDVSSIEQLKARLREIN